LEPEAFKGSLMAELGISAGALIKKCIFVDKTNIILRIFHNLQNILPDYRIL
jgi:hypothetical protein